MASVVRTGLNRTLPRRNLERLSDLLPPRGCYTLVISLAKTNCIQVGKLGKTWFPAGTYLYTGRAMNSLKGRLCHHLNPKPVRSHWHIDYLLRNPNAHVTAVLIYFGAARHECILNQSMASLPGAKLVMKGFGASDCAYRCASHLTYLDREIRPRHFTKKLRSLLRSPPYWKLFRIGVTTHRLSRLSEPL